MTMKTRMKKEWKKDKIVVDTAIGKWYNEQGFAKLKRPKLRSLKTIYDERKRVE